MRDRQITIVDGILYHADAEVIAWVNAHMGAGVVAKQAYGFGILDDGWDTETAISNLKDALAAGVYFYDQYDANEDDISDVTACVYIKDKRAIKPRVVRKILEYPFNQLGVRRISAMIDEANVEALDQAQRIGFQIEGYKRFMAPNGRRAVMLGLLPEECPFWKAEE